MTKRKGIPSFRWLNLSLVAVGITAAVGGAHLLQSQEIRVVTSAPGQNQAAPATGPISIQVPAPLDGPSTLPRSEAMVVELAPVPTIAAPASPPLPRPVARSRSSR